MYLLSLFFLNTITYYLLGPSQLQKKRLSTYFGSLSHQSDSVFMRNYYTSQCGNEQHNFIHFRDDSAFLINRAKEMLGVNHVYFNPRDSVEEKFPVRYYTYAERPYFFWAPFTLFGATMHEELLVDNKYGYSREMKYTWCFFFWIKRFEFFKSWDQH
jgi:hypothetical protein